MHIVGGTYWEWCREGDWRELYGSGLRACASLSGRGEIQFTTCIGPNDLPRIEKLSKVYDIQIATKPIEATVGFSYAHALSTPTFDRVTDQTQIHVSDSKILRFGMIECDAVVEGKVVVYDPQAPNNPELFKQNGSKAERLAIICNRSEAFKLTQETDPMQAGQRLAEIEGAEVVVIKCGSDGALVFEGGDVRNVPAFRTARVWPIGSGDVFSAVFFHRWAEEGMSAVASATEASKATAYYCHTQNLPIISDIEAWISQYNVLPIEPFGLVKPPEIYLAGPFFNMMQRWLVEEARQCLSDQGLDVFSPFHDVGIGPANVVVSKDIDAINRCDAMFAIIDHLDSGTLFEVGYATAKKIPVVGLAQDVTSERLKMLLGTGCTVHHDFVSAIYNISWIAHARKQERCSS